MQAQTGSYPVPLPAIRSAVRWRCIAVTLLVTWIIGMIDKIIVGVVMANSAFLKETQLAGHPAQAGMLTSGMLLTYALGMPVWGWVVAKIGARKCFIAGLLLWALSLLFFGLSSSFGMLLFWRLVLGFGEAALYPVSNTYVNRWFPDHERARASSIWWSGTMMGPAIAGFSLAAMMTSFGWRAAFFILVGVTLVIALPMAVWLTRNSPEEHPGVNVLERDYIRSGQTPGSAKAGSSPARFTGESRSAPILPFYKNYGFWMATLAFLFNNFFFWGWSTWLPSFLHQGKGLSLQTMGNLTTLIYGMSLITIYGSAIFSDRLKIRSPFGAVGYLVGGVLVFLAVHMSSLSGTLVCLVGALMFQQIGALMIQPALHRLASQEQISQATGVLHLFAQGGSILSPTLIGALVGNANGNFTLSFEVMSGCLILAGLATATLIPRRY
ncbi:MAG: MFS transporter [Alicyclobacillus sp.]|nr:MFS transporter [Alicyclobacillus sp.]